MDTLYDVEGFVAKFLTLTQQTSPVIVVELENKKLGTHTLANVGSFATSSSDTAIVELILCFEERNIKFVITRLNMSVSSVTSVKPALSLIGIC